MYKCYEDDEMKKDGAGKLCITRVEKVRNEDKISFPELEEKWSL
jgi:hypothetical protein